MTTKGNPEGTLTPAYGRDYVVLCDAQADFDAGKDFIINNPWMSTPCSIRDFSGAGKIKVRFARMRKSGFLKYGGTHE